MLINLHTTSSLSTRVRQNTEHFHTTLCYAKICDKNCWYLITKPRYFPRTLLLISVNRNTLRHRLLKDYRNPILQIWPSEAEKKCPWNWPIHQNSPMLFVPGFVSCSLCKLLNSKPVHLLKFDTNYFCINVVVKFDCNVDAVDKWHFQA